MVINSVVLEDGQAANGIDWKSIGRVKPEQVEFLYLPPFYV